MTEYKCFIKLPLMTICISFSWCINLLYRKDIKIIFQMRCYLLRYTPIKIFNLFRCKLCSNIAAIFTVFIKTIYNK